MLSTASPPWGQRPEFWRPARARGIAWRRFETCSLAKMLLTWFRTVIGGMNRGRPVGGMPLARRPHRTDDLLGVGALDQVAHCPR